MLTLLLRIICLSTFLRSIRKSLVHFYVYLSPSVQSQSEGCLWTETETEPKKISVRNPNKTTNFLGQKVCIEGTCNTTYLLRRDRHLRKMHTEYRSRTPTRSSNGRSGQLVRRPSTVRTVIVIVIGGLESMVLTKPLGKSVGTKKKPI